MVVRSIADIYDRGVYIFVEARSAEVNMSTEVVYVRVASRNQSLAHFGNLEISRI